ncbi:MAG: hypothetical protein H0W87_08005 [Actinobacteria bacterium]|nr:hypothetical protein [Actinomycetota bacterium]
MRRLGLVVLTLVLAVPAVSFARPTPPGDGTLVIRNGRGVIVLQVKGAVIGWMASGKLTLTDNDPYDENAPLVRGRLRPQKPQQLNDATTVYKGQDIRYRMMDGSYRLRFEGTGIHLSAVGRGWVAFDGDDRFDSNGFFSLSGSPFEAIPVDPTERIKLQVAPPKPPRQPRRVNLP